MNHISSITDLQKLQASLKHIAMCSLVISWQEKSELKEAASKARNACMSLALYLEIHDVELVVRMTIEALKYMVPYYYDEKGARRVKPIDYRSRTPKA